MILNMFLFLAAKVHFSYKVKIKLCASQVYPSSEFELFFLKVFELLSSTRVLYGRAGVQSEALLALWAAVSSNSGSSDQWPKRLLLFRLLSRLAGCCDLEKAL